MYQRAVARLEKNQSKILERESKLAMMEEYYATSETVYHIDELDSKYYK